MVGLDTLPPPSAPSSAGVVLEAAGVPGWPGLGWEHGRSAWHGSCDTND